MAVRNARRRNPTVKGPRYTPRRYDYSNVDTSPIFIEGNTTDTPNILNAGQNPRIAPGLPLRNAPKKGGGTCYNIAGRTGRCFGHMDKSNRTLQNTVKRARGLGASRIGRYASDVNRSASISTHYREHIADSDPLSMLGEVALLRARVSQLINRAIRGEAAPSKHFTQLLKRSQQEFRIGNSREGDIILEEALAVLRAGDADGETWREIMDLTVAINKLTRSEQVRAREAKKTLELRRAMALVEIMLVSIEAHVKDTSTRRAIKADFDRAFPDTRLADENRDGWVGLLDGPSEAEAGA